MKKIEKKLFSVLPLLTFIIYMLYSWIWAPIVSNDNFSAIKKSYSDIINNRKTKIVYNGSYSFDINIKLKTNDYDTEKVAEIRDEIVAFLYAGGWEEIIKRIRDPIFHFVNINFVLAEDKKPFYQVYMSGNTGTWNVMFDSYSEIGNRIVNVYPPDIRIERKGIDILFSHFAPNNALSYTFFLLADAKEDDIEKIKESATEYLNSEEFIAFVEDYEWLNADDTLNVTLVIYWSNYDKEKYIAYKSTDFTIWEKVS